MSSRSCFGLNASLAANSVLIAGVLTGIFVLGYWTEKHPELEQARSALRSNSIPSRVLSRGRIGVLARRLRLFETTPSDLNSLALSKIPDLPLDAGPFQKKRKPSAYLLEAQTAPGADIFTQLSLPADGVTQEFFNHARPVLAITIPENELNDPDYGILANWNNKGPEWEREARVTFYDKTGRQRLDAHAGLRLHGGKSRWPGNQHSYRLHFKEAYGQDRFPDKTLFSKEAEPVRQVVVWNDWPISLPFNTALAFDVSRQIGCLVPELHPALLVLNGRPQGLHYLLERPTRKEWVSHFGHTNFVMHTHKRTLDPEGVARFAELSAWARNTNVPMTLAEANARVDVDHLSRWIFAMVFCGTTDGFQGPGIIDKTEKIPRWRWLIWDMDHSFARIYPQHAAMRIWEKEHWSLALCRPSDPAYSAFIQRWDIRAVIFSRLLNESPKYREVFFQMVTDLLNHRLTREFAESRLAYYSLLAQAFEFHDKAFLDEYKRFLEFRPFHLREALRNNLGLGPTVLCRIVAPPNLCVLVDGYPASPNYQGWYFPGQTITVAAQGNTTQAWRVNENKSLTGPLKLTISKPLNIAWAGDSTP